MPSLVRTACLTTILSAAAVGVTACGGIEIEDPEHFSCPVELAPLALVVGARANSPIPSLPDNVEHLVRNTLAAGEPVSVISIDGAPRVAFEQRLDSNAGNGPALEADYNRLVEDFAIMFATATLAEAPEADLLAAIDLASRQVPDGGTLVVLDSGIQTVAPLDFTQDGFIAVEPADVVSALGQAGYVPDLQDRNVVFAGLGDTAEPQEKVPPLFRTNLIDIWTAIISESGACVEVVEKSLGNQSVRSDDLPPVSTAPMPPPSVEINACGETVFDSTSPVRFEPKSAVFVDERAATEALSEIAQVMIEGNRRAELIGTTATAGTAEGRLKLSEERAEAVKSVLIGLGVPADQIATSGVGAEWPEREEDIGPNGELLDVPAARNRSVIVQLFCE